MAEEFKESPKISPVSAFCRTLAHSLPFLLFIPLGTLLCALTGSNTYPALYIAACAIAVIGACAPSLISLYRAFPQKWDDTASKTALIYTLSGIGAIFCAVLLIFIFALIPAPAQNAAKSAYVQLFTKHTASLIVLFIAVLLLACTLFSATSFSVLLGKTFKKRHISRTCLAAVPVFAFTVIYYVFFFFIASFLNISIATKIANSYIAEGMAWFLLTLSTASIFACPALAFASIKLSLTKKLTIYESKKKKRK